MPRPSAPPLLLASGSPRRRELLEALGVPFELAGPLPFEEWTEAENAALSPSEFAWRNALGKALAAAARFPGRRILAADTVVCLGPRIYGKPKNRADAAATLRALAGKRHAVRTAVVVVSASGAVRGAVASTPVRFRPLTAAQIAAYLDTVDVMDKAGSYAVQEEAGRIIAAVEGSLSNVIGLPVAVVAQLLRASC